MAPDPGRVPAQVLRGRGLGAQVGTLIGAGWLIFALRHLAITPQIILGASGSVAVLWLLVRSGRLLAIAHRLPAPDMAARTVNRRVWIWFWVNFAVEIALLNVAAAWLDAPDLRIYLLPAISLVVGLHFFPLAVIFDARPYWACGGAMAAVAIIVIVAVRITASSAPTLVVFEALCNALILWATAAWGVLAFRDA